MTGLGYTLPAVLAVLLVVALEFGLLHTGLFRRPAYWLSMLIVLGFQVPVDGWMTKRSAPIVSYDQARPAACGSRSTSRSRISCSASRWSPRC